MKKSLLKILLSLFSAVLIVVIVLASTFYSVPKDISFERDFKINPNIEYTVLNNYVETHNKTKYAKIVKINIKRNNKEEFIDCIKGYSDEYGQSFYETESEILNNCDTENNKALAFIDKESFSQKNTKHYVYTTQAYYKIISKEFIKIGVQQTVSIDIIDTNENEVTVYLSNFTGEEPENI